MFQTTKLLNYFYLGHAPLWMYFFLFVKLIVIPNSDTFRQSNVYQYSSVRLQIQTLVLG